MARKRGNRWQADVKINGERVRKSFETQEAAEDFERLSSCGEPDDTTVRFKAYAEDNFQAIWGDNRRPDFTRNQLRDLYRVFGENRDVTTIDTDEVDEAIADWRGEGLSASTINHRLSVLSKFLKYCRRRRVIPHLPDIQRQSLNNQLERVMTKADERKAELFFAHVGLEATKHIVTFFLYTGCRRNEGFTLTRDKVRDGWVHFDKRLTKNGKSRQIPLVPKAKEAWDALCKMSDLDCPLQIVSPWTFTGHWELLRAHFGAEDDRAFVPHMLRHTCATRLVAAGVALPQVMKWMGHQSIQVTMRYIYVAPKDLDVAAAALSA